MADLEDSSSDDCGELFLSRYLSDYDFFFVAEELLRLLEGVDSSRFFYLLSMICSKCILANSALIRFLWIYSSTIYYLKKPLCFDSLIFLMTS